MRDDHFASGYFVFAALDAIKPGGLDEYGPAAVESIVKYGGNVEALVERDQQFEGNVNVSRVVIIRFASRSDAAKWYESEEYQAVKPLRLAGATTRFIAGYSAIG